MSELSSRALKRLGVMLRGTAIRQMARALLLSFPNAEIFLVGGYVRDLILERDTSDIDLVVRGVPTAKLEKFLSSVGKVNLVGKRFGVFKFIPKHKNIPTIDIALPRTEHAFGTGGYRDVDVRFSPTLSIQDDLGRRDFTINAMAWDILNERLIDPWNGLADIRAKKIRAVGKPTIRFREDYSRILRALRFACQLEFDIEPKTMNALTRLTAHLNDKREGEFVVAREIVAKELLKGFSANPSRAIELYDTTGALKVLIPELLAMKKCPQPKPYHSEGDVWTHTALALKTLTSRSYVREFNVPPSAETVMAVLFHDIGKPKTITMPKVRGDRIRFNEHDAVGAKMTRFIAERLRLSSYKDEVKPSSGGLTSIDVDADRLAWLVRYHLLLVNGDPRTMRATTIEKYYLRDEQLGQELLALNFIDGSASHDANGRPSLTEYRALRERIHRILGAQKPKLPAPLLNGHDIMKKLHLKSGPEIGRILNVLREAQLTEKVTTKREAIAFIKNI